MVEFVAKYERSHLDQSVVERFELLHPYLSELSSRLEIGLFASQLLSHIIYRNFYLGIQMRSEILSIYVGSNYMYQYWKAIEELEGKWLSMFRIRSNRQIGFEVSDKIENLIFRNGIKPDYLENNNHRELPVTLESMNKKDFNIMFFDQIIGCAFESVSGKGYDIVVGGFYHEYRERLDELCADLSEKIDNGEIEL